tara:strand:+ start:416 stop:640 length:225 start_codon:yes stop_codon:yes gene_type:complete
MENKETLKTYVNNVRYIVIDEYQMSFVFNSLREIAENIHINHSTISKKMINKKSCFLTSKNTGISYYISLITLN